MVVSVPLDENIQHHNSTATFAKHNVSQSVISQWFNEDQVIK